MTLLAVYEGWKTSKFSKPWAYENLTQHPTAAQPASVMYTAAYLGGSHLRVSLRMPLLGLDTLFYNPESSYAGSCTIIGSCQSLACAGCEEAAAANHGQVQAGHGVCGAQLRKDPEGHLLWLLLSRCPEGSPRGACRSNLLSLHPPLRPQHAMMPAASQLKQGLTHQPEPATDVCGWLCRGTRLLWSRHQCSFIPPLRCFKGNLIGSSTTSWCSQAKSTCERYSAFLYGIHQGLDASVLSCGKSGLVHCSVHLWRLIG